MLGHKVRQFKPLTAICLENLVPADNFCRQVERRIDLSFVREFAAEFYSNIGRTSVDPVVFFKLQLIAFFEGIRSERKLMETVNLNLAHRWFIGYDLHEPVPDHSSLSKIRERFGIVGLEERGIKAYLPTSDFSQSTKYYSAKLFQYDAEQDHYVCPQGQILPLASRRTSEQVLIYKPKAEGEVRTLSQGAVQKAKRSQLSL